MTIFNEVHLYGENFSIEMSHSSTNHCMTASGMSDVEKSLVLLDLFKVRLVSCEKNLKGIVKMSVQV